MDGGFAPVLDYNKWDYQEALIYEIKEQFRKGYKRVACVAPTGSGKSVITAKLEGMVRAKGKEFRYLAPRKLLVYGVGRETEKLGGKFAYRMSDEPYYGGALPSTQLWCTPSFIGYLKTFKATKENPNPGTPKHVDLFVIDEAHTFQPAIVKITQRYPESFFVFLTATPLPGMDRFFESGKEAVVQGPSVKDLQQRGILVPIRYKSFEPDGQEADVLRGEIVSTWIREAEGRKTVVFCKNRKEAKHIQERFVRHGIAAEYMDANTSNTERDAIRERVHTGESKVLVNVEVMSYGVDWPFLECVVLAYTAEAKLQDTPNRLADYIQKVGRGLRACEGKKDLLVIDHTGTVNMFRGVEEDREWQIDSESLRNAAERERQEVQRERTEPELITCRECGFQFLQMNQCPRCNAMVWRQGQEEVEHIEANISDIDPNTGRMRKNILWTPDKARIAYAEILWCVRNYPKGAKSDGMAFHIYEKLKTGVKPPYSKHVQPVQPSDDMKAWGFEAIRKHIAHFHIMNKFRNQKEVA